jgi:outer membrane biosynthesis protein TonB
MKHLTITSIGILFLMNFNFILAQESALYNPEGQLRNAKQFSITKSLLEKMHHWECKYLYDIYNSIEYPKNSLEYGIQGNVYAEITIYEKNDSISCKIVRSADDALDDEVIRAITINKKNFMVLGNYKEPVILYLPFSFKLETDHFLELLKRNNSIAIDRKLLSKCYYTIH